MRLGDERNKILRAKGDELVNMAINGIPLMVKGWTAQMFTQKFTQFQLVQQVQRTKTIGAMTIWVQRIDAEGICQVPSLRPDEWATNHGHLDNDALDRMLANSPQPNPSSTCSRDYVVDMMKQQLLETGEVAGAILRALHEVESLMDIS